MAKKNGTAVIQVVDEKALALKKFEEHRFSLLERVKNFHVKTMEDCKKADTFLHEIKAYVKAVDDYFGPDIKSAKDLAKSLKAKRDAFAKTPEEVDEKIRLELSAYVTAQQRKAEEKRVREIEKAEEKNDAKKISELMETPVENKALSDVLGGRKNYFAVITDAKKIPAEYFIGGVACGCIEHIDQRKLDAMARTLKELFAVPGAKVEWNSSVVVK